jgi:hypothetical protein
MKPVTMGFILTFLASLLAVALFIASRQDSSLRIAALVCVTGLVTNVVSIASTLLIGKDVTHRDDLPPNTSVKQTTEVTSTPTPPDQPKP